MRAYADSSFIVKLITREPDSESVIADYRRVGKPALFFLPLHALEVRNAILQRAFHQRRSLGPQERRQIASERDAALARLEHLILRHSLLDVLPDMEIVFARASTLSKAHTERLGARAIDVLHVAAALSLESELFLTTDYRQSEIARAEGLTVASAGVAPRI